MRALLATAVVLAALAPAAEAAAPRSKALIEVEQLQQGKGVETGRELSPALAHLAAALPSMSPADRRRAESIHHPLRPRRRGAIR